MMSEIEKLAIRTLASNMITVLDMSINVAREMDLIKSSEKLLTIKFLYERIITELNKKEPSINYINTVNKRINELNNQILNFPLMN